MWSISGSWCLTCPGEKEEGKPHVPVAEQRTHLRDKNTARGKKVKVLEMQEAVAGATDPLFQIVPRPC